MGTAFVRLFGRSASVTAKKRKKVNFVFDDGDEDDNNASDKNRANARGNKTCPCKNARTVPRS